MKNKQENKKRTSATEQLVITLSNSKYSYAQFTYFHETVLEILDYNDLTHLTRDQMKSTVFFIDIIVGLLDAPKRTMVMQRRQSCVTKELTTERNIQDSYDAGHLETTGGSTDTRHITSGENFHELIQWISRIVLRKHITIETMLDEFYALNFISVKKI